MCGVIGYGTYHQDHYCAKVKAKFDRHFGANASKQEMAQEGRTDYEVDSLFKDARKDCKK